MKTDRPDPEPQHNHLASAPGRIRRVVFPVLLLLGILVVAYLGRSWWESVATWIEGARTWGYLVYFLTFIFLTTFCFPVSVLGFSAGAMFGPGWGLLLLVISGVASGSVMFAVGRYLFRDRILGWVASRPKLAALDNLAEQKAHCLEFASLIQQMVQRWVVEV